MKNTFALGQFLKIKSQCFWDKLNIIRAGILGANDGIISVSGIVLGASGANLDSKTLLIAGLSGTLAGACSMAGGEWMSVSTQRDILMKKMENQLVDDDLKFKENDGLTPISAALSSFFSFIAGAIIPLCAMTLSPMNLRIPITLCAMIVSLALNAFISTLNSEASVKKAIFRNIFTGVLTGIITFTLGSAV
ncbi:VIT1/CCC1 transporter family protein [Lactobacillus psittaci]|uniref:Integral membrane protein n=1 Tax=Lactobacillus psittaci DSM 15354 TaxID=1122152 RepID=A0A0R1S3Z0_9LACO|nr:VIT1/CCC1 transporter family protein [Lactobacillus psittaci]KRL63958.1 hypothetical protein FC23_GL000206 [Lactobacillus psittaci DSM 15354]